MALAVALALLAPASVSGQEAVWTMDSCMQYAVTHASDVQRQRIVTRQNEQNYRRAIADFLPSVGASVGAAVGTSVGASVGAAVGTGEGSGVGAPVGEIEGASV